MPCPYNIEKQMRLRLCVYLQAFGSVACRDVETPGGGLAGKEEGKRKQTSASLLFYHPLVGKNVIKSTASSEAPSL